jgi:hypothetical protein
MDKALADAIRAIDSNTGQGSMAAKERKRKKPPRLNDGKPKGGRESKPPKLGNAIIEPKIEPATLCMSAQQRLEAAIRQHKRQLDSEFEQRIQNECKRRLDALSLPAYAKEMAEYVEMVKSRKGHLTREVYRSILACLNSATRLGVTDKRLDEAFVAFKKLELVLCNEKEASTPNYTFPRTFAEMMARKQAVSEARKTKRASRGIPERR